METFSFPLIFICSKNTVTTVTLNTIYYCLFRFIIVPFHFISKAPFGKSTVFTIYSFTVSTVQRFYNIQFITLSIV